jgi:hypothetical protein
MVGMTEHTDSCSWPNACVFLEGDSHDCVISEKSGYESEELRNFDDNGYDGWRPCKYYLTWEDAIKALTDHIEGKLQGWTIKEIESMKNWAMRNPEYAAGFGDACDEILSLKKPKGNNSEEINQSSHKPIPIVSTADLVAELATRGNVIVGTSTQHTRWLVDITTPHTFNPNFHYENFGPAKILVVKE